MLHDSEPVLLTSIGWVNLWLQWLQGIRLVIVYYEDDGLDPARNASSPKGQDTSPSGVLAGPVLVP